MMFVREFPLKGFALLITISLLIETSSEISVYTLSALNAEGEGMQASTEATTSSEPSE